MSVSERMVKVMVVDVDRRADLSEMADLVSSSRLFNLYSMTSIPFPWSISDVPHVVSPMSVCFPVAWCWSCRDMRICLPADTVGPLPHYVFDDVRPTDGTSVCSYVAK